MKTTQPPLLDTYHGSVELTTGDQFRLSCLSQNVSIGDVVRIFWIRDISAPRPPYKFRTQDATAPWNDQGRDNIIRGSAGFARVLRITKVHVEDWGTENGETVEFSPPRKRPAEALYEFLGDAEQS